MNYLATKTHEEPQMHIVSERSQTEKAAVVGVPTIRHSGKAELWGHQWEKVRDWQGWRGSKDEQVAQRGVLGQ